MEKTDYIFGIRTVIEAIEAGKNIDKIMVRKDLGGDLATELVNLVRERGIVMQRVPQQKLDRITRKNHQGVIALISSVTYQKLDQIVPMLYEEGMLPFIIVLDGITDVRNFGAISRTAECAGVDAVVIPEHGSVSVQADAVKTSAGALHYMPVCRERNIYCAVRNLKERGIKVVAVSEKADKDYTSAKYCDPVALVLGAEDTGISEEVLKLCDEKVSIPMFGNIGSLNVSVAAGVLMYEVVRQRLRSDIQLSK